MSNNNSKPTSTVVKKPQDVINDSRAKEEAKQPVSNAPAKAVEAPKAAEAPKATEKKATKKRTSKQYSKKEWQDIINDRDTNGLSAKDIAEKYEVEVNNVYQWATKLKNTPTGNGDKDLVAEAKKMQKGIAGELAEFDKKIEAAKALVANAVSERKKIEDKNEKYQQVIDLFDTK